MKYSFKFFTGWVTFLGVSSLLMSQTIAEEVIFFPQKQQFYTPFHTASHSHTSTVQQPPKPTVILETETLVQEDQSNVNPFDIIVDSGRRGGKNIEDILNNSFSTFAALFTLADKNTQDILTQENVIVFAPTNDSLKALGDQLEQLKAKENREQLIQLLRNHIVVDGISESQFQQGDLQTLGGERIPIRLLSNDETDVNGIKVLNNQDFIQALEQKSIIVEIDRLLFQPQLNVNQ